MVINKLRVLKCLLWLLQSMLPPHPWLFSKFIETVFSWEHIQISSHLPYQQSEKINKCSVLYWLIRRPYPIVFHNFSEDISFMVVYFWLVADLFSVFINQPENVLSFAIHFRKLWSYACTLTEKVECAWPADPKAAFFSLGVCTHYSDLSVTLETMLPWHRNLEF